MQKKAEDGREARRSPPSSTSKNKIRKRGDSIRETSEGVLATGAHEDAQLEHRRRVRAVQAESIATVQEEALRRAEEERVKRAGVRQDGGDGA